LAEFSGTHTRVVSIRYYYFWVTLKNPKNFNQVTSIEFVFNKKNRKTQNLTRASIGIGIFNPNSIFIGLPKLIPLAMGEMSSIVFVSMRDMSQQ
jgi:hypothetical protein